MVHGKQSRILAEIFRDSQFPIRDGPSPRLTIEIFYSEQDQKKVFIPDYMPNPRSWYPWDCESQFVISQEFYPRDF